MKEIRGLARKELPIHAVHEDPLRSLRREKIEKWFDVRADNFIKSAARGLFTKKIQAHHLRAEFKAIARALGGEGKLLEDWFEIRAQVFVESIGKKSKLLKVDVIDVDEVRNEFKLVAREYDNIMQRFETDAGAVGSGMELGSIGKEIHRME